MFELVRGTVKWFNPHKRYGFIEREEEDEDVFVHLNEIQEPIGDGDEVEFDVEETEKGPQAKNVKKIE